RRLSPSPPPPSGRPARRRGTSSSNTPRRSCMCPPATRDPADRGVITRQSRAPEGGRAGPSARDANGRVATALSAHGSRRQALVLYDRNRLATGGERDEGR